MFSADGAQWVSALAAIGALAAATFQIRGLRKDARATRAGEIRGVALETVVKTRPIKAETSDGRSTWEYLFTVHNPGRFPITEIEVHIEFAVPVQRVHYDGSRDTVTRELTFSIPVVPARGHYSRRRAVLVDHDERTKLRQTQSTVRFTTPDAGRLSTTWPGNHELTQVDRSLRRLVSTATDA